jgi:hypothetical protein
MVSLKSIGAMTFMEEGAGDWPLAGALGEAVLAPEGTEGSALLPSILTALLEMTNRRRTGGAFNFGVFGLLLRVGCGVFFAAVALRFNINNQTNESAVGSENRSPTTANMRLLTKRPRSWL